MRKILPFLAFFLCFTSFSSLFSEVIKGSGRSIKKEIEIASFRRIEAGGHAEITVKKGKQPFVTFWAEDNLADYVKVQAVGGTLYLGLDQKTFGPTLSPTKPLRFEVTTPQFEAIRLSGLVSFESSDAFDPYLFDVRASGKCEIGLNLNVDKFEATLSGASLLNLKGEAKRAHILASGASEIEGEAFKIYDANLEASGAVKASLWVLEYISGSLSGTAKLKLKGEPEQRLHTTGAATVN